MIVRVPIGNPPISPLKPAVDLYCSIYGWVARKWPRGRGSHTTPGQAKQRALMPAIAAWDRHLPYVIIAHWNDQPKTPRRTATDMRRYQNQNAWTSGFYEEQPSPHFGNLYEPAIIVAAKQRVFLPGSTLVTLYTILNEDTDLNVHQWLASRRQTKIERWKIVLTKKPKTSTQHPIQDYTLDWSTWTPETSNTYDVSSAAIDIVFPGTSPVTWIAARRTLYAGQVCPGVDLDLCFWPPVRLAALPTTPPWIWPSSDPTDVQRYMPQTYV